jgi:hypothetical protein
VAGKKNNPDLRAALAAYEVASHEVTAAWAVFCPRLAWTILRHRFKPVRHPVGRCATALGCSDLADLTSSARIAASRRRNCADCAMELNFAQKQLLSRLRQFYLEAKPHALKWSRSRVPRNPPLTVCGSPRCVTRQGIDCAGSGRRAEYLTQARNAR